LHFSLTPSPSLTQTLSFWRRKREEKENGEGKLRQKKTGEAFFKKVEENEDCQMPCYGDKIRFAGLETENLFLNYNQNMLIILDRNCLD
jgi:hypothetical protein